MPLRRASYALRWLVAGIAAVVVLPAVAPSAARADATTGAQVSGTLVRAYVEHKNEKNGSAGDDYERPLTWIDPGQGAAVRVPTQALADVAVGSRVTATVGAQIIDNASANDGITPARSVLAATVVASPAPSGGPAPQTAATASVTDTVSIAMVVPAGGTQDSTTLSQVVSAVSGPVASFWSSQSNGTIQLRVGDTHDWAPAAHDCSDPEALWQEVATTIGFTPGPGKHLLLYVPSTDSQCAYGMAEVGSSLHAGGNAYVQDTVTSVIAHELGHNFGLLHSATEECNGTVESNPALCNTQEYGDLYDVMAASWSQVGSLNAAQADRLGLLLPAEVQTVDVSQSDADVTLAPLGGTTGTRVIRLVDPPSPSSYYLEYRAPVGQDAFLGQGSSVNVENLVPGLLLHRAVTDSGSWSSLLLDGSPSSGTYWYRDKDPTFPVSSQVIAVPGGDFGVTLTAASSTSASVHITSRTPIALAHAADGGDAGAQGGATGPQVCGADGGCHRPYANATIYWSARSGAHAIDQSFLSVFTSRGGTAGVLGYPTTDAYPTPEGGSSQLFLGGGIHASPATGAHVVFGTFAPLYDAMGGESGALGYPLGDPYPTAGNGWSQAFEHGGIHWSASTGPHAVSGTLAALYDSTRGESGVLGYPVSEQYPTPGNGESQAFQNGGIHYSPQYGAFLVWGTFAPVYDALRGESGPLGYPRSNPYPTIGNGWSQAFAGGGIHWSPASGAHSVYGSFAQLYDSMSGELSPLGYPVSEPYPTAGGGWSQAFQGGGIHWSPATPVLPVVGAIAQAYDPLRGESGPLGYPVTGQYGVPGGVGQNFQHGSITVINGHTSVTGG